MFISTITITFENSILGSIINKNWNSLILYVAIFIQTKRKRSKTENEMEMQMSMTARCLLLLIILYVLLVTILWLECTSKRYLSICLIKRRGGAWGSAVFLTGTYHPLPLDIYLLPSFLFLQHNNSVILISVSSDDNIESFLHFHPRKANK